MKKLALLTTSAMLLLVGNAFASTEGTVTLGATSSDISYAIVGSACCGFGGALTPNVNLITLSPSQLVLTGNAYVISPPISGPDYIPPESGLDYGNNYLSVFGHPSPAGGILSNPIPGMATFNLAPGQHTLGFTWGSVDAGNTLTVTATNATYTITGTDIANALLGGITYGDADLFFNDTAGTILSATFTSTNNAFEAANFEDASAVPLPAALPLMGAAMLGMGAIARRRKA